MNFKWFAFACCAALFARAIDTAIEKRKKERKKEKIYPYSRSHSQKVLTF